VNLGRTAGRSCRASSRSKTRISLSRICPGCSRL